jgi:hypothetical protein
VLKPDWKRLRSEADTLLPQSVTSLLEPWHEQLKALFTRQLEDKPPPYKRRPQVALRLWHTSGRKLIVHPGWSPGRWEIHMQSLDCELLEGKRSRVTFGRYWIRDEEPRWLTETIETSVVEDITAALATIKDCVDDWRAVLARSADHCCCG